MLPKIFPFDRDVCASALQDIDTPAVVLFAIMVAAYGDEMYSGEPEQEILDPIELWHRLREDFDVDVDVTAENRINAMRTAVETDLFFFDVETFAATVSGIAEGSIDDLIDGNFGDITVAEIMQAIFEISSIRGDERPPFAPAVLEFITKTMADEVDDDDTGQMTADAYLTIHRHRVADWFTRMGVAAEDLAEV